MVIRTSIPAGNGRVHWIDPKTVEIELIAYSKNARYTTFEISDVAEDVERTITLRPDSMFAGGSFARFHAPVWSRVLPDGEWARLPEERVEVQPEAIRLRLALRKGETVQISTEPPRLYVETVAQLYELSRQHRQWTQLHWIGHSWESRPIPLLRVSHDVKTCGEPGQETKPVVFCMSGEHATESAGEELVRGMLSAALEDTESGRWLRDQYVMDFLLTPNPDGNVHGWHQYNKRDWLEHNYAERVDRSWHHEFGPYFAGELTDPSPETVAVAEWIRSTRPVFYQNAHSWEGHNGNPGSFRSDPAELEGKIRKQMERLDEIADDVSKKMDIVYEVFPRSNSHPGHLGNYMVNTMKVPGCTIEGHMALGRDRLQAFGAELFREWLGPEGVVSQTGES